MSAESLHPADYDALLEEGRRLASQRDDLIARGVDPDDLDVPLAPHRCPDCSAPRIDGVFSEGVTPPVEPAPERDRAAEVEAAEDRAEQAAFDAARERP